MGRFALELYEGPTLIERVRFDFPMLGGPEADAGYFAPNANADDWTDAADKVARGDAAMTLMGTWITGYWNGQGLAPGADYDFFEFPAITDGVPNAVVGPVDGLLIAGRWSLLGQLHDPHQPA